MQSDAIKKGIARAPARAMLKATGLTDADIASPLVAVANTWTEVTPCNFHLRDARGTASKKASAPPAARPSNSTPSRCPTASPWAPKA